MKLRSTVQFNTVHLLDGLIVVLILLLTWQVGSLLAQFLQPVQTPPVILPRGPEKSDAHPSSPPPQLTLFGTENKPAGRPRPAPPPPPVTVRPSRLHATLLGTLVGPQGAIALIHYQGQTHILKEGETLIPGVTLRTITADTVILDNRGRLEKLSLETADQGLMQGRNTPSEATGKQLSSSQRARLNRLRQTLRQSPLQLLNYVRVEMVDGGRHLKLYPAREADLFRALGLRPGDVVTQVNGRPVSQWMRQPMEATRLLQQDRITLTIRRQGREETLTLDLTP